MADQVKLSPPWITYYHEVDELFKRDKSVSVVFDNASCTLRILVDGEEKADALSKLFPITKEFGNVVMKIDVIPANKVSEDKISLFEKAFKDNSIFRYATDVSAAGFSAGYVVFEKSVVQFFNDNLGDINGNKSTLYEDIARDVFGEIPGVYFCTDSE